MALDQRIQGGTGSPTRTPKSLGGAVGAALIGILIGVVYSIVLGVFVILIFDPAHGPPEGFTGINQPVHGLVFAVGGIPAGAIGGLVTGLSYHRNGARQARKSFAITTIVLLAIAFLVIRM